MDCCELGDVARIKGLSAAAALQRLSSHPKAIGIGMRISKRRGPSSSLPPSFGLNEEIDFPSFIEVGNVAVEDAEGEGVANMASRRLSLPAIETSTSRRRGSSRWKETDSLRKSGRSTAVRRSSSTASLRQLMRRGSADICTTGTCSPVDFHRSTPQVRRRSSISSIWSMSEDNQDQEGWGGVAEVAFSRGLSAAKMETLQRVSSEHKAMRLL